MNDRSRPKAAPETPAKASTQILADPADETSDSTPVALNPEHAYCGALMWHPAESAARSAGLVEPGDLADPQLRVVLQLVRDVAADGVRPDPVVCMAHARAAGTVSTAHGIKQLAELLADLYADCPLAGSVGHYAAGVLDQSLRRRCAVLGMRVGQVAESGSLAELVRLVGSEVLAVYELRNRRAAVLAGLGMTIEAAA